MIPDQVAKWKMENPIFRTTNRISMQDILELERGEISYLKEYDYLLKAVNDLHNLMIDMQVSGFDLFPHLVLYLIKKRKEVLKP